MSLVSKYTISLDKSNTKISTTSATDEIVKWRKDHPRCSCCKYHYNRGNWINPDYFCKAKCTRIFLLTARRICRLFTPVEYV